MAHHNISDPPPCPSGYADNGQVFSTCTMCTFNQNGVTHCPCENWMTCAHRNYGEDQNCDTMYPFMYFKVRECTQGKPNQTIQSMKILLLHTINLFCFYFLSQISFCQHKLGVCQQIIFRNACVVSKA